jgi:tRNA A37 threonylcarbamoyladenosine synthetase subunit TsaC/SUA5/YrdC
MGIPSTVVEATCLPLRVLRLGALSPETLRQRSGLEVVVEANP